MLLCPIQSPCRITQKFGLNPQIYGQFGLKGHPGIDFTGPKPGVSVRIYSPIEGKVVDVGDQKNKGYGKYVRIRSLCPDGTGRVKEIILGHLSRIDVVIGQFIPMGEYVGMMGNTGFSTAMHLHMGLRFIKDGPVMNANNGFAGYIDFLPFIVFWVDKPQVDSLVLYPNG
jgi:murein DD-endopeptidase MepM/ murein hydrolase activator NlpD